MKIINKSIMRFFIGAVAAIVFVVLVITNLSDVKPYNTLADCKDQFKGTNRTQAGNQFCECIHLKSESLKLALKKYKAAPDDTVAIVQAPVQLKSSEASEGSSFKSVLSIRSSFVLFFSLIYDGITGEAQNFQKRFRDFSSTDSTNIQKNKK